MRRAASRRRVPATLLCPLACWLVAALLLPGAANARGLTAGFFDDAFSAAGSAGSVRLDQARDSGAGIVRIRVTWPQVAPTRPADGADPADPAYRWSQVDGAVAAAHARGLRIMLSIFFAPAWAEQGRRPARHRAGTWKPDPAAAGDFATALARRYAGRVDYLQVWNEPNLDAHLSPQWERRDGKWRMFAPVRYRQMLNAAYPGVHAAGLKLVTAGTAPYGDPGRGGKRIAPVRFWRRLLATDVRFDVFSHHPYGIRGPRRRALNRDDVAVPDMQKLTRIVRQAVRAGRAMPRQSKRYWVTELSWDSRPPDPSGVSERRHATWLSGAFYELWKDGVDTVMWFRVRDGAPNPSYATTYQSGVYFLDGSPKIAQRAFAFPMACDRRRGRTRVWARLPQQGTARVQTSSGHTLKRVRSGADRVVWTSVGTHARLRVSAGGARSLSCKP